MRIILQKEPLQSVVHWATIIGHMQTTMTQSGLYDSLEELDELLNQYDKVKLSDPSQAHLLEHFIIEQIQMNQMLDYINLEDYHNHMGYIIEECHKVLIAIKIRRFKTVCIFSDNVARRKKSRFFIFYFTI